MPFNLIRATLAVYGRRLEVASIIIALILCGGVGGYALARAEIVDLVADIRAAHIDEIDRLQAANREALRVIADRVDAIAQRQEETASRQEQVAGKVESVADTAQRAAITADGAAANASRTLIRERVIPGGRPEPERDPTDNNADWLGGG